MIIDFEKLEQTIMPNFKGGEGQLGLKKYQDSTKRIMQSVLKAGSTIGLHKHENDCEIMYFISGEGVVICDGKEERVAKGLCHYCPKGSSHTLINTSKEDLVMFAIVIND